MRKLFLFLMTLVMCAGMALAQNRTVKGVVMSVSDGEPVIGATIMPVGGGEGTATDIDGNFTLSIGPNVKEIRVSYVGMATKVVPATPGTEMHIDLSSTATDLDEVMVVAYGTAKKSAYTGSASVVKSDALETSLVSNAVDAINGRVAGVQMLSSNGQPGSSPSVRIRGVGSINAENSPLYVVDGIPYDGDVSNINTMDIESMTVLKDAAAAALYGARGANGVILITTKTGKAGATKVIVDARWGQNSRAISNYDVLDSSASYVENVYRALYNGFYYNGTKTAEEAHAMANAGIVPGLGYQVYTLPDGEGLIGVDGKINPNAKLGYTYGDYYFKPDDWTKEQLRNGLRQEYNLNISGGSDRMNYFVSGGYLDDQGLIRNSHFKRLSTRTAVDYQLYDWLKIGTNLSYAYVNSGYPADQTTSNSSGNAFSMAYNIAPYYPMYVRNADGKIRIDERTGNKVYDYGDGMSTPFTRNYMSISNPAGNLVYDVTDYLMDILDGKWYAIVTPLDGLTLTGNVGYHLDNTRFHDLGNPFYGQSATSGGSAYQVFTRTSAVNLQGLANYRKTIADVNDIDLLLGYESYDLELEDLQGVGYNLYLPNSWVINNTIDNKRPYGSVNKYATRGIFGRANYSYNSRYFASASVRRDASSRFAPGKRWGTFWSVSAGWDVAKENFMQEVGWVDQLKVKASFGQQGNDNLGRGYYPWQDQYQITGANGVWSDGTLYLKGNPDITWETSNNINTGLDFSLFQGKVFGTVEYFSRQTSNMLYNKPVSPSNGYSTIPMNIGSMRNDGVELELNYRPIATKNFTWDLNANLTTVKNKIIKLHPDLKGKLVDGTRVLEEGESMYQLYIVDYAGVDPATGLALYWDANPKLDDAGNPVKDDRGDYVVGEQFLSTDYSHARTYNRKKTGDLMPKAYGGFGTTLKFYGFDFAASFAYQFGGKILDYSYQSFMHGGDAASLGRNWHKDILNAWTPENTNTDVPRLDGQDQYTNATSTRWLVSSNYLSLQNMTLGYSLPQSLVKSMMLSNVRVYVSGENLFLFSARKGMDPRQGYIGTDGGTYTGSRSISAGFRLEF